MRGRGGGAPGGKHPAVAGSLRQRIFLVVAGVGFDAVVVERLHRERSGHGGHIRMWTYAKPILESIRSYTYPEMRISAPRRRFPGRMGMAFVHFVPEIGADPATVASRWIFVSNLPRYAGGLNFSPAAVATDGLLDVCTFDGGSLARGLWYVSQVWLGSHGSLADCRQFRTSRLRIWAT